MNSLPLKQAATLGVQNLAFVEHVFPTLQYWLEKNVASALITLVNIEGSSPRPVGSQMAVNKLGESVGLISGGCLEKALTLEASTSIELDECRLLRYGKDSDYFDIQLPCGSGIDVFIQPVRHLGWLQDIERCRQDRVAAHWQTTRHGDCTVKPLVDTSEIPGSRSKPPSLSRHQLAGDFQSVDKIIYPSHRVLVVGDGPICDYFLHFLAAFEMDILHINKPFTPGIKGQELSHYLDRWSSLVCITHEHAFELPYLVEALQSEVGYIAALGSLKTHQSRLEQLQTLGFTADQLRRIKSPAGINIGGYSPPEIALSIIAELIARKNEFHSGK